MINSKFGKISGSSVKIPCAKSASISPEFAPISTTLHELEISPFLSSFIK